MTTREEHVVHLANSNIPPSPEARGIYRLPIELLDLVLHNLREDKPTILACSQVSRLWHEVALRHLFAFLKIASRSDFVEFRTFLHANADIARHVRKLELKRAQTSFMGHYKPQDKLPAIGRAELRDLVAPLPRLQELHLHELYLIDSPTPAPTVTDDLPDRTLEKLTFERCRARAPGRNTPLATILNLVSVFASVGTLELVSMRTPSFMPSRLIRTVRVRTVVTRDISLPNNSVTELYTALRGSLVPGYLRSLDLGCAGDPTARYPGSFGQLVHSAARRALHIHILLFMSIPLGRLEHEPRYWHKLNLHACTSLRSLALEISVPPVRPGADTMHTPHVPLARVCVALLTHIPPTVRILTLKL
ncbi:hypothetical protein TRAPUB_6469 [Trametes pubescens]|uniref:F-box domain-containing protein n=1 Tax=Trametes pubescens TaxID=154538 RepID=A0A1M2V5S8_TRAPU|nr:hypothetical protein TRAPUB_6469 [Trametes pubescens]